MKKQIPRILLTAAFVAATGLVAFSQQPATAPTLPPALAERLPVDPQITMGKFANGLTYYIRANAKPEKRAELRLIVKAGSVLEDDDQQGLAHVVEHMAFEGTTHFPKHEIQSFIESLGMRFGADLNASTSFDETIYTLTVPTDKIETLDRALLILEDWAHNVTFEPAGIDTERGIVMEEWRLRRGAGARTNDKLFPILLKGSRYADRLPIGKPEIIQNFAPDRLKKFYTDWYRPELMAVVAVGDFDKAAIENLVRTHFAAIPAATAPRPRPSFDLPDHTGAVFAIITDKETTSTAVEVDSVFPAREQDSLAAYRQQIVERLVSAMLSARYSEIVRKPAAPFLSASTSRTFFVMRSKEMALVSARVKEDGIEQGLDAALSEVERVSRFGFTATELDRQKQNILRSIERAIAEKENRLSSSRAAEYIRNFLQHEPLPRIEDEYALHQRFLPQITIEEVNQAAKGWLPDQNRLVVVTAPEKSGLVIPDESKLTSVIKAVVGKNLTPYVDTITTTALLDTIPTPSTIVKTAVTEAIGTTEWELANGVRVVLKPTTFRADEILFRATSPGGTSLASDKDFIPASTATQVITAGGLGKHSVTDLGKLMTGKIATAGPVIGELEEGLTGNSSRQDLETMFQLIYLRFTQPRADPEAFSARAAQTKTSLANQTAAPGFAFSEMMTSTLYQNHLRRHLTTPATVDEWNLETSLAFYRDRFADASDFTFVFVGSFDLATMKPLVELYLGGLPSLKRKETWKDIGVRTPAGVVEKRVEKGIEPRSQTAIVFSGTFEYDQAHRVAIAAMADVLQTRLLDTIRQELGATYSITARQSYQKIPKPEYSITIQFGSDPLRAADITKRVFEEIALLKSNGPTEKQAIDEKEALLRSFETNSKLNSYWVTQITGKYVNGEEPASLREIPEYYRKLDAATIQQAAKTYLNTNNYVKVILVPENK